MMKSQTHTLSVQKPASSSFKKTLTIRLKVPPKIANDANFSKILKISNGDVDVSQVSKISNGDADFLKVSKVSNGDADFSKVSKISNGDADFSKIPAASNSTGNKCRAKPLKIRIKRSSNPPLTGNKCRDFIREKIAASLNKAADEVGGGREKVGGLAASIETQLYEVWGLSNGPKKPRYMSVLFNLNDSKNPDFRSKVLGGVFLAEKIPSLTPNDMASKSRQLENQRILDAKIEKEIKVLDA